MITKFIRKLLGRTDPADPPAAPTPTPSPASASVSPRAPAQSRDAAVKTTRAAKAPSGKTGETAPSSAPRGSGTRASNPASAAPSTYRGRDPVVKRRSAGTGKSSAASGAADTAGNRGAGNTGGAASRTVSLADEPDAPVIIAAEVHGIDPSLISRNAVRVTQGLQEAGFRAFIVGGAVRDLLLGVAPKDFDVATDATPDQVSRLFRRARIIGRRFQIVHVQFGQEIIEVSTFRALVDPAAPDAVAAAAADADVQANGTTGTQAAHAPRAAHAHGAADERGSNIDHDTDHDDDEDDRDAEGENDHDVDHDADARNGNRRTVTGLPDAPSRGGRRRRREDPDRRLHAVDASGRVLRDNVWGEQHEDARRRDFTINAMYYDPATQTVLDYHEGMADIRARLLRMIGDPVARYREDPVRMLRVVRFAAKLGFEIEAKTREPIAGVADLINNVPAARVFDEMLKLLLSGHALACLQRLRAEGLHRDLLPLLDVALEQPHGEKFISLSLTNTDIRIRAGKPVSPGFLFAALLWHQAQERWQKHVAAGEYPIPALHRAMDEVLDTQTGKLAIQRRFIADMKEIWGMQPRLEKRSGRSALKLLEHPRFRAAYDFLLLRCESGELDPTLGQWWTDFIEGDPEARETLLNHGNAPREARAKPRRRRRGGSRQGGNASGPADGTTGGSAGESSSSVD